MFRGLKLINTLKYLCSSYYWMKEIILMYIVDFDCILSLNKVNPITYYY